MSIAATPEPAPHLHAVEPPPHDAEDLAEPGDVYEDDGALTPAPITGVVGQKYTVHAINLDERYLGHTIAGRSILGHDFAGPLNSITRHQIDGLIVVVAGEETHHLLYRDPVLIVVVRSMPQDPRQRALNKLAQHTR